MNAIMTIFYRSFLPCLPVFLTLWAPHSYASEKYHESGKIYFYGALLSSACSFADDSEIIGVDLGDISAAGLTSPGALSQPVSFHLNFKNCLRGASSLVTNTKDRPVYLTGEQVIRLRFLGESDTKSPHLLRLYGGVKGVGLKIWDNQNRAVNFDQPSWDYILQQGDNTISFRAALEATDSDIMADKFEGIAYVQIIYL